MNLNEIQDQFNQASTTINFARSAQAQMVNFMLNLLQAKDKEIAELKAELEQKVTTEQKVTNA